jgi:chromatin remodeling complex protein RSC6
MAEKNTGEKKNALQQPVKVSGDLETIVGKGPHTRAQVTSKVWEYIKKHDLQKESDKRVIVPDDQLGKVIGKEEISMFKMTAAVSKHLS